MMTKGLLIGLLMLTYTLAATYMTFDQFIQKFNKKYTKGTEEYVQKEKIYNTNIQELIKKNCAECGVTKFFDISQSQFNKRQLNLELPTTKVSASMQDAGIPLQKVGAPTSIDWRDRGVVTRPKDQGQCGCCWSFATCALAQSNLIMKGLADRSIDLSEQYLLKCTPDGDCQGGYIQNALKQVYTYGAPLESKYPYNPYQSSPGICLGTSNIKVTAKKPQSFYDLGTEDIKNLLTLGPLAIAIDSTNWEYYTGGTWKCNPKQDVNHAVLLVGYTSDGRWIIKNQWGEDWGENGYMYVSMDPRYNCNIGTALHMLYAQYFQAISLALLLVLGLLL